MKKILFALALTGLMAVSVSCGNRDNTNEGFNEPRFVQSAGQLIPASGELKSVDLSESGIYVVHMDTDGAKPASRTKASGGSDGFFTGQYQVNNGVYTLNGWGTIEFNNSASGNVDLKYTPSGKPSVTVSARFTKSTANNDIFRSWSVDKTRVTLKQGATTFAAEFAGCDFKQIADFFRDNGYKLDDVIQAGRRVSTFSVTGAGALFIVYGDGTTDLGSCTISGNSLSYNWEDNDMGYSFETGRASFEFQDGKCIFSIDAKLEGGDTAAVKLVLSPVE